MSSTTGHRHWSSGLITDGEKEEKALNQQVSQEAGGQCLAGFCGIKKF